MTTRYVAAAAVLSALLLLSVGAATCAQNDFWSGGVHMRQQLTPIYPSDRACSPLTSLFSSWDDVDGTKRDEPHSGVDGGRLGEPILAPAPGEVIAVWQADWGWGPEGALLLRHTREDLGLTDGPAYYYSEFDHLRYDEIRHIRIGGHVKRGDVLAHVYRPGGNPKYLPEVHWEVWSIEYDDATAWQDNKYGGKDWVNASGHLLDPLSLMSLATAASDRGVVIAPFDTERDHRGFRGFTYILPCPPLKTPAQTR